MMEDPCEGSWLSPMSEASSRCGKSKPVAMSLSKPYVCRERGRKTTSWRGEMSLAAGLPTALLLLLLLMLPMLMLLLMLIVGRDHALTDGAIMRRSICRTGDLPSLEYVYTEFLPRTLA